MYPIIDLFAGPGGLNEGFSNVYDEDSKNVFETRASFEMDKHACQTLRLRETYRRLKRSNSDLTGYYDYIEGRKTWEQVYQGSFRQAYQQAAPQVQQVELGESSRPTTDAVIAEKLGPEDQRPHWVLIGGPPCQAYSLAGRSRRKSDESFSTDHKHFLYREYLHILSRFKPSIFVMENVKGLLSSKNGEDGMFQTILNDLSQLPSGVRYEVRSIVVNGNPSDLKPNDFIIKAENYGVPQKRHRVILLGVRSDIAGDVPRYAIEQCDELVTVRDALTELAPVCAAISNRKPKRDLDWKALEASALASLPEQREHFPPTQKIGSLAASSYKTWIGDGRLKTPIQHAPRAHMVSDLVRYRIMAEMASRLGKSPKYTDLPKDLYPDHKNVTAETTPFTDRFRVQIWESPATTIVSHISKDGHYYIHPDPDQNRSLTVREAARLQSFPDNYFFEGARTQQFHQVGNAVPPLLSRKIGKLVAKMLASLPQNR